MTQGSLYPALHRLEQQGWLKAQAGVTHTGREAKFYALTAAGRKQLARELESWDRLSNAIGLVVREAELIRSSCAMDRSAGAAGAVAVVRGSARPRAAARIPGHLQEEIDENSGPGMTPAERAPRRCGRSGRSA